MRPRHGPAHNRARVAHNRAYLFWQSSVFTNRVFNLRIFAAVISFAQCLSHHHRKQCFDNDCSCDTYKCTNSACFGSESMRSRSAILSATCPVVCCAMLGCVQFGSVVWRVTREYCTAKTNALRKHFVVLIWKILFFLIFYFPNLSLISWYR